MSLTPVKTLLLFMILTSVVDVYLADNPQFPTSINATNIWYQYIKICGAERLCTVPDELKLAASRMNTGSHDVENPFCQRCFCDTDCYNRGDCCPDKLPVQCQSTVLHDINEQRIIEQFYMVSTCPETAKVKDKVRCEENANGTTFLKKYPVTSDKITFKNQDCARCNNVTNFEPWQIDITCAHERYFTQYSSQEEVWHAVRRYGCTLKYIFESDEMKICEPKNEYLVNKCNVTGQWILFDKDIEWACGHYDFKYGIFQNVFCYLCNSGKDLEQLSLISNCNITGEWDTFSPEIENSCQQMPREHTFLPYKNRYCYSCNNKKSNETSRIFKDANISLLEFYQDHGILRFKTNVTIKSVTIDEENTNGIKDNTILSGNLKQNTEAYKAEYIHVNITKLYQMYVTAGGKTNWCTKSFQEHTPTDVRTSCYCDKSCYFRKNCCPDMVFTGTGNVYSGYLWSAFENADAGQRHTYIMVGNCPKSYLNETIVQKCKNPTLQDTISLIPVFDKTEVVSFRNIYCRICNSAKKETFGNSLTTDIFISIWNLQISCQSFFSFKNFPSLRKIIQFAINSGCTILTFPKDDSLSENDTRVAKCNVTGSWISRDDDVEKACQNGVIGPTIMSQNDYFQNVFCEICNHNILGKGISVCNIKSIFDVSEETRTNCQKYPENKTFYPFKNEFCEQCNIKPPDTLELASTHGISHSYRHIFSINELLNDGDNGEIHGQGKLTQGDCLVAHVYDPYKEKCRKLYCAVGKHVVGESCLALFNKVKELKYQISLRLESVELFSDHQQLKYAYSLDYKTELISLIQMELQLETNVTSVYLDSYFALLNVPCKFGMEANEFYYITSNAQRGISGVKRLVILMNFSIHIKSTTFIERSDIENKLINFTQNSIILHLEDDIVEFIPYIDQKAFYLPSTIYNADSSRYCKIVSNEFVPQQYGTLPVNSLEQLFVNKLLLCRQIELEEGEFDFVSNGSMLIKKLNRILKYGSFQLQPTGNVRICVDDYFSVLFPQEESIFDFALYIFSLICTCVSLTCLLLTFFAYIKFPILQSLPGKNIMCLVIALFFAQLTFLIGSFGSGTIFCQVISGLIHYFWLSCFFCMNVCSFHMHRVFTSSSTMENSRRNDRKILRRYCLYSFGTPLIIVLINLSVGLVISDGRKTLYGGSRCLNSEYLLSLIFSFLVPIFVISVSNMVFFAMTACKIKITPNDTSIIKTQYNFGIYVKLFALTGVTWILQIIEGFFEKSLFSFIVTLLNGCQGVYIFVSYICTSRVYKTIKEKRDKGHYPNGTSDYQTRSRILKSQTISSESPKLAKSTTNITIT